MQKFCPNFDQIQQSSSSEEDLPETDKLMDKLLNEGDNSDSNDEDSSSSSSSNSENEEEATIYRDSLNIEEIKQIFSFCYRIVEITAKIHQAGYSHQDLKLDNFMLAKLNQEDMHPSLKLIDFENGAILGEIDPEMPPNIPDDPKFVVDFEARYQGSVYYKPPWIEPGCKFTRDILKQWDVFSIGFSIYTLIQNR